ncbi:MAG TPA: hypothetical protein VEK12_09905 [Alphaproteobacteria bacterium]|nr:hypothetical protein [Alphaproteobacteria bacterium]
MASLLTLSSEIYDALARGDDGAFIGLWTMGEKITIGGSFDLTAVAVVVMWVLDAEGELQPSFLLPPF